MISFFFGLLAVGLLVFMSWRILEKAGLPGWVAFVHVLSVTGIGFLATLVFFWVVAFIRWPRDDYSTAPGGAGHMPPYPSQPTPSPRAAPAATNAPIPLPDRAGPASLPAPQIAPASQATWALEGKLGDGTPGRLVIDDSRSTYIVSGTEGNDALLVPDPSVGSPHARILTAPGRIGLEDLGSPGGTWIDGVRLLPSHGARDIGKSRLIRFGMVELTLARL